MTNALRDLRSRASRLFLAPPPAPERGALEALSFAAPEPAPRPLFSAFLPEQVEQARDVWQRLITIASDPSRPPLEAIDDALAEAEKLKAAGEDPDMIDYATMVFLAHHR